MTEKETKQYILSQWISEDFLASDLISNNHQQPIVYINPQFTFLEKFLEKREIWGLISIWSTVYINAYCIYFLIFYEFCIIHHPI